MRIAPILLVLPLLAAGCFGGSNANDKNGDDQSGSALPPHVVVADIDSGINVYHERFAGSIPDALVDSFIDINTGLPPVRVKLTMEGNFTQRYEADREMWGNLSRQTLYYFEGTRILGISFLGNNDRNPVLDFPNGSHGTATAGSVFDANPEAILVMVEGVGNNAGEMWAMNQPWIDITTMSYGPVGSPPTSSQAETGTHAATHAGWRGGKLPVGAADNTPSLAPNDATAGPPWVIGVAGDHFRTKCRDHVSGTFPDVTANFTQFLPRANSVDARGNTSGTSFATPTTAGTLSAIVLEMRKAWNHTQGIVDGALAIGPDGQKLLNRDVREAMNRTAYYFSMSDCAPAPGTSLPVNSAAPWLQMGWGHVGPEIVGPAVQHLLGTPAPAKPSGANSFQQALYDYRVRLWGQP
jgi:subtilisin family serine protease